MGKDKFTKQPEIVAAIISVVGTLVGTLLISVFLGFLEGRLGLGPVVAVITLLLVLCIWGLLAFRWGVRLAGAAAAAMVIVGSVVFLIVTAAQIIPFGGPSATPVALAASPTPQPMPTLTTTPPLPTPPSSPADQARAFAAPILAAIADRPPDFEDDFTTADKGWGLGFPGGPPNGDQLEITDGVVRMTLFEGSEGMVHHRGLVFKNFVLMVDSRQVSGGYRSSQMVVWGLNDHWGQLAIESGKRHWFLSKGPSDQWPPRPEGSGDVVSPIGETNHILIVARGPQLAIYLNDVPVAYVEDQELDVAHGKSLSFNCGGRPDMVCEFDNIKLWNLDNVPGLP